MTRTKLSVALLITALVAVIEFWGGFRSGSLALTTDALHVCMDVFALAIALAATIAASRPATVQQTFGFGRVEILAAVANAVVLLAATVFIAIEAIHRFAQPQLPGGAVMTAIASIGLLLNGGVGVLLARDHHHNMNVRAALYHVAGDILGAFAVIVGGVLILRTGANWIDPALSVFVAVIIVAGVVRILGDATHVLLESVPQTLDPKEIREALTAPAGVVDVHDLHVWTIGTQSYALAAHVLLEDRRISEATTVLRELETLLRERFAIGHVTLQFECESCEPDQRVICTQVTPARPLTHEH